MKRILETLKLFLACLWFSCCTKSIVDNDLRYKSVKESTWYGQGLTVKFVAPKTMILEKDNTVTEYSYNFIGKEKIECEGLEDGNTLMFTIHAEGMHMKFGNCVFGYYNLIRQKLIMEE